MVKIYVLKDPITLEIRYIGKTIKTLDERLAQHYHSPKRNNYHNACWVGSLRKKGLKPIIELLELVDEEVWEETEKRYIKNFRNLGYDLTNYSDGGSTGMLGKNHTKETRLKMSRKGKDHSWYGRKHSIETKLKISESISNLQKKPILQIDLETKKIIKEWDSLKEAKEVYGKAIGECARGKSKTSKGYIWKYK